MASSSDEGEIIENGDGSLKASSLPRNTEGNGVDRRDRNPSRQSSPDADTASRYSGHSRRSRSPRGYKRSRGNDDPYAKGRHSDSRNSRGHYNDPDRPQSRGSFYEYEDRERHRGHYKDREMERHRGYEDRDRYSDKRQRNRSPSPYRSKHSDKSRAPQFVRERRTSRDSSASGLKYDENRAPRHQGPTSAQGRREDNSRGYSAHGGSVRPVQRVVPEVKDASEGS